jgi:hypothetical protein
VTWENSAGPKKCSFDGHKIEINNALRDVMTACI